MSSVLGGKSSRREEAREDERTAQRHNQMQSMWDDEGRLDREYLAEITDDGLHEGTEFHLQNMLTKDFVLSNLSNAEVTELKWLTRNIALQIRAMHPAEESVVQGEYRKFLFDDPKDALKPLSPHQKVLIDQVTLAVFSRVARSKSGWQQDKLNESIKRSEVMDNKESKGRLRGLFG